MPPSQSIRAGCTGGPHVRGTDPECRQCFRRILVCGSRDWRDRNAIYLTLLCEPNRQGWGDMPVMVIHGGARGADSLADDVANELGYHVRSYPAEWEIHGKAAGPIRNRRMLAELPDLVVAFGDGRGTNDTVSEAERRNIPVMRI